jgi:hypothetical protein
MGVGTTMTVDYNRIRATNAWITTAMNARKILVNITLISAIV